MWLLNKKAKQRNDNEVAALYWQDDQLSLLAGSQTSHQQFLINVQAPIAHSETTLATALKETIHHHQLEHTPTTVVLPSNRFELFLLDSLPINDNEIHAALRWRLKELITYPIQEACWDYFQIPTHDARNYLLCAIVSPESWLRKVCEQVKIAGLNMSNITIPQISLKNLLVHYPKNINGTGLLYIENATLKLIILNKETLYLLRQFDTPYPTFSPDLLYDSNYLDELSLFLQRSFDYYQAQLHQAPLGKLLLMPQLSQLKDSLSQTLSCQISTIEFQQWIDPHSFINHLEGNEIFSLGALFGQNHVATNQSLSATS